MASYACPASVEEAVELLAEEGACVLAGGTDLVLMRAAGLAPTRVVDVKRIERLQGVTGESIGAATTLDALGRLAPSALTDGARIVGGWQTRSRATLGGNVCRASPAGDTLCGLLVLGAAFELSSSAGARSVAAAEFFRGPGFTARAPGELLTRIALPGLEGGSAYRRFTYRGAMDLAVVGVAARISVTDGICREAAIAIAACGPTPRLVPRAAAALVGSDAGTEAVAAACAAVVEAAEPIDDVRGTRRHRLQVLTPLTRRVIAEALARA
jgi:CO/xanthine dehydrogenase FAD-binding subunit